MLPKKDNLEQVYMDLLTVLTIVWFLCFTESWSRPILAINEHAEGAEIDEGTAAEISLPVFLIEIQKCMNLQEKGKKIDCFDFTGKDAQFLQEIISHPDKIWGFVGNGMYKLNYHHDYMNTICY